MATRLNRGEIWLLNLPRPDKRRPVLILSRPSLIGLLNTVTVGAVTVWQPDAIKPDRRARDSDPVADYPIGLEGSRSPAESQG
ncbi:MAG: type II toxin-antitoxin system PemK/MazF family toxin [Acidobacteria bacterium]|nr:type II toxin-antitoxin system PemK/MazF family toxin [Acidobacteriota bacterium]